MISSLALCDASAHAYGTHAPFTVTEIEGVIIIAGRGTEFAGDVLTDVAAVIPEFSFTLGQIPGSFLRLATGTLPQVVKAIAGRPYALTGHSLGGAWAQITAASLVAAGSPPVQLTTFGAPRVGRLGGVLLAIAGEDFRHRDDPVPTQPALFSHPRAVTQLVAPVLELDVIEDHRIAHYRAALAGLALAA